MDTNDKVLINPPSSVKDKFIDIADSLSRSFNVVRFPATHLRIGWMKNILSFPGDFLIGLHAERIKEGDILRTIERKKVSIDSYRMEEMQKRKVSSVAVDVAKRSVDDFLNIVAEKMESAIHNIVCFKPKSVQNILNLDQIQTNRLNKIGIADPLCVISYELKKETPSQKLQMVNASVQLSREEYAVLNSHSINGFHGKRIYGRRIYFNSPLSKLESNVIYDEKELSTPKTSEQLFREVANEMKELQNRIVNSIIQNARLLKPRKTEDIFGNIEMSSRTKEELAPVLLEVRLTQENN